MPKESPYVQDPSVKDIGNHVDPDLELLASLQPDLVIIGQRFAAFYEEIKALLPEAAVIDLAFDVSAAAEKPGEALAGQ